MTYSCNGVRLRASAVDIRGGWRLEVTRDPDDNIFLEWADAARADYPGDGQSEGIPKIQEEKQSHDAKGIYHPGRASFNQLAKSTSNTVL
jgi:hypothetical protein